MNAAVLSEPECLASSMVCPVRAAVLAASISREAGGLFWTVKALSESLIGAGCEIRVFGGEDSHSNEDKASWGQTPVSVQAISGPRAFGFQRNLMDRLRAYRPDLVHVHGLWMYPSAAALRWSAGSRPHLISPRGMLDPWAVRNSAWKKKISARLYEDAHLKGATCIHALCDAERDAIRAYGLRNPVAVIPNGVDLPDLDALVPPPEWSRQLPTGAKVLLFLSRIHPKKGLVELIDAWASARQRRIPDADDWYLVIAGWEQGGHQAELEQQVRALRLENSVRFVGPQFGTDKAASFRRADAFVLPSHSEGLPMAVLEAWSYGLPVAMTPQCNLPEGFAAGAAIQLLPERNALVDGLATLFGVSEAERQALGQRGRRLVERKFVWKRIGSEMADVYRWVLGQAERPGSVALA